MAGKRELSGMDDQKWVWVIKGGGCRYDVINVLGKPVNGGMGLNMRFPYALIPPMGVRGDTGVMG